jgi:transcriptional regulator with XRE-family HTH domain
MTTTPQERHIHQGRNIKRFREMLGMKQEALATELGDDWTQKKVSLLEAKEEVDTDLMEQVARILKIPADAIRNFDEETAMVNIQNNYEGSNSNASSVISGVGNYHDCTFNPLDKMVELYERMLKQQEVMIEKLERLLQDKK